MQSSNKYISLKRYRTKNAKQVLFFFPAGFTKMWQYWLVIFWLNRMKIEVVGFNFKWRKAIREVDFEGFVKLIRDVDRIVDQEISQNKTVKNYSVLGLSFGSVLSLYTAKRQPNIRSIILFVPYGTLSRLLWTYRRSKPFLRMLHKSGVTTEAALAKITQPIETQNELSKLKGRSIVSFSGTKDRIVFDGQTLIDAMKTENLDTTFYEYRLGHFGASVWGLAQKRKWKVVLEK